MTEDLSFQKDELPDDRSLIIVDDDRPFLQRLAQAMGCEASRCAARIRSPGIELIRAQAPAFAVVDMRLEDRNGLDIAELTRQTGYASSCSRAAATSVAVSAVSSARRLSRQARRRGRRHRRAARASQCRGTPPENPMSADRVAGSTFSACTSFTTATSRRPRAGSMPAHAAAYPRQAGAEVGLVVSSPLPSHHGRL